VWLPIPLFPDYEASTDGRIRSLERTVKQTNGSTRTFPSKVLKPGYNKKGYAIVTLIGPDRSRNTRLVHRLILETYHRPRWDGEECCHVDGNPSNNHIDNIYWGTPADNMKDKIAHGTYVRGERVGNSVLTEEQVLKIYEITRQPCNLDDLAAEYGVSRSGIEAIKYRKYWKWLTDPTSP